MVFRSTLSLGASLFAMVLAVGCATNRGYMMCEIKSPQPGEVVKLTSAKPNIDVHFEVANFRLAPPGKCSDAACGQAVILVDKVNCGQASRAAWSSPVRVNLSECAALGGRHEVEVGLRNEGDLEVHKDVASCTSIIQVSLDGAELSPDS